MCDHDRQPITEESGVHKAWIPEAKELQTREDLHRFIDHLLDDYQHDYGTCVYAAAAMMVAVLHVADNDLGGLTGFQASCLFWELARELNGVSGPAKLLRFDNMIYPQYAEDFAPVMSPETWEAIQKRAREGLAHRFANRAVRAHMEAIVAGQVPFGWTVKAEG